MKYSVIVLIISLLFNSNVFSQEDATSILIKGGKASYNDAIGSFGGGGVSYDFWEDGPQFSAGIERPLNKHFSYQGLFAISVHNFDKKYSYEEATTNSHNYVFDLMANIKWNLGIFYFLGGAGFSYQYGEVVKFTETTDYHTANEVLHKSKDKFVLAGLLGLGFDIHIYNHFNIIIETEINMREYMGSALLGGIKYKL